MRFIQLKTLPILLIFCVFINTKGSTIIRIDGQCSCESILYKEECQLLKTCQYKDSKCSTIPCNSIDISICKTFQKCAIVKDKCVDFVSCSQAQTSTECEKLHTNCYFNTQSKTCDDIKDYDFGSCSQQLTSFCILANEGLCVLSNGKCTQMTSCSQVNASDLQCFASFPACYPDDESDECMSNRKCQNNSIGYCAISKEKINSDEYLLCQQDQSGCSDFNPSTKTQDTCARSSLLFFHWDGNGCIQCFSNSLVIAISIMAILVLNI